VRWLALSGIAFVVCFAAAAIAYGGGAGSSPAEIHAYYSASGEQARQLAGFGLLLLGAMCLLLFVATLRIAVIRDELLGTVAVSSGAAAATLLTVANGLWAGTAFTAHFEGAGRISRSTHLMLEDTGFGFFIAAAATAIPFVAATALAAAREEQTRAWFGWLSVVAVGGLATAYWYVPTAFFLAWVLAASALAFRVERDQPSSAQPTLT
jgi:hypothetical protein